MNPTENLTRLQDLLYSLLHLDTADLDFGIYRLLKIKEAEIRDFIENQLPNEVEQVFQEALPASPEELHERLAQARNELLNNVGEDALLPDDSLNEAFLEPLRKVPAIRGYVDAYQKTHSDLQTEEATEERKAAVFNTLYNFFHRYYQDGDFMPRHYYGAAETYAVPYNGEETFFHWTTRGQHYVKTGERLRDYAFRVQALDGEYRIRFVLATAHTPKENLKGKTRFFFPLTEETDFDEQTRTLIIPFAYRLPSVSETEEFGTNSKGQEVLLQAALPHLFELTPDLLLPYLEESDESETPYLLRHLRQFVRRQTGDYFIHPDLKNFLVRELDFYLKDQVLTVGDILSADLSEKQRFLRVVRRMALILIDFLGQLEEVENRLFEKRKFVLSADYLTPIQNVSKAFYPEILANSAQIREWQTLFDLNEDKLTTDILESHPTLIVNTRHFDEIFKWQLLESFGDIDDALDGILINGENYQAIRFLEAQYVQRLQCIYIDPPYNTGSDEFIYKDRYQHASWLSMMEERLHQATHLLADDGVIFVSIDDNEQPQLRELMDRVLGAANFIATVIWQKVFAPKNTARYFSEDHDFILVYAKNISKWRPELLPRSEETLQRYSNPDSDPRGTWSSSDLTARNYYSLGTYEVTSPSGDVFRPAIGTYWRVSPRKFEALDEQNRIWWGPEGSSMPRLKRFLSEVKPGVVPQTLWKHEDVGHTQDAKKELVNTVAFARSEDVFNTVKPIGLIEQILRIATQPNHDWILDFFAGSGSTAHGAISLNRKDDGNRRFILVEMGDHFDNVLLPRIQRVLYCPEWKNGQPAGYPEPQDGEWPDWVERTPRLLQVLRLEFYEDSLHNLSTDATLKNERARASAYKELLGERKYTLRYLAQLPLEASASMLYTGEEQLTHPFDYTIEVLTEDGPVTQTIDLITTFNYLYGLRVERMETWHNPEDDRLYRVIMGHKDNERTLIVWRDMHDLDVEQERAFLEERLQGYHRVFINGNTASFTNVHSIDAELKRLLEDLA